VLSSSVHKCISKEQERNFPFTYEYYLFDMCFIHSTSVLNKLFIIFVHPAFFSLLKLACPAGVLQCTCCISILYVRLPSSFPRRCIIRHHYNFSRILHITSVSTDRTTWHFELNSKNKHIRFNHLYILISDRLILHTATALAVHIYILYS
jgi:hypothetical protein